MELLSSFSQPHSSSPSNTCHTIRSYSFPTRSHPGTLQVEEEITNLKTWEASFSNLPDAETICTGLISLERLYMCVENLLGLPLTQQALSHHQYEKLVNELLDRSLRLLDICGSFRDLVSQVKGHVRDVQSALRRKKGDFTIDSSFLKKLMKDAKRAVAALKGLHHIKGSKLLNLDNHLFSMIKVLRDVTEVSISVFGLLLSFLSMSTSKPKSTTKLSLVSKLIPKGTVGSNDQPQIWDKALDCHIEGIENGLECIFRRLIKTRVSLLNI